MSPLCKEQTVCRYTSSDRIWSALWSLAASVCWDEKKRWRKRLNLPAWTKDWCSKRSGGDRKRTCFHSLTVWSCGAEYKHVESDDMNWKHTQLWACVKVPQWSVCVCSSSSLVSTFNSLMTTGASWGWTSINFSSYWTEVVFLFDDCVFLVYTKPYLFIEALCNPN